MFKVISQPPVKDYVPFSWASLVHVKKEHYRALAHYYVAVGILDHKGEFGNKTLETLQFLHEEDEDKVANLIEIRVPQNQNERRYLGTYLFLTASSPSWTYKIFFFFFFLFFRLIERYSFHEGIIAHLTKTMTKI